MRGLLAWGIAGTVLGVILAGDALLQGGPRIGVTLPILHVAGMFPLVRDRLRPVML